MRRAHRRKFSEAVLHHLFFYTPYRCDECDARFFRSRLLASLGSTEARSA